MNHRRLQVLCLLVLCWCVAFSATAEQSVKPSAKAKEHFEAGLAHLDDPGGAKYEEAYREFQAAYAETPSHKIALNLGYCAFYLERDAEALRLYQLYLSKVEPKEVPKQKREQLEKDVLALRAGLVTVSIKVEPAKATVVDERFTSTGRSVVNRYPVENGAVELGIHPGNHKITLLAGGFQPQSWEFDAPSASAHSREFKLAAQGGEPAPVTPKAPISGARATRAVTAPPAPEKRGTSPTVYVGAVATGVFAVGAVSMGLMNRSKKSDFEAANDGSDYDHAKALRSDMKTYAVLTDVCIGAAVASAGMTTYFYVKGSARPESTAKSQWQLVPSVGRSSAGVAVSGSF